MSYSFGDPSEVTPYGYRWHDSRDKLPPNGYGRTAWSGKFPEGSVDADLQTFTLISFIDGNLQFCLGRCPKGVRIHLQLNFKVYHYGSDTVKEQHWWVYDLTEKYPFGYLLYPISNPDGCWLKSVSIDSVERTAVEEGSFVACPVPHKKQKQQKSTGGRRTTPPQRWIQQALGYLPYSSEDESDDQSDSDNDSGSEEVSSNEDEVVSNSTLSVSPSAGKIGVGANSAGSCVYTTGSNPTVPAATCRRPSLPTVVNFAGGEMSTLNNFSPNASGAAALTLGVTLPITSNLNGIDRNVVNSNEDQTELPQLSFETLRLIKTLVETENELAKTQAELKTSQAVAENLWSASTLYETQLQQAKSEAEAKSTQLQLKCDRLEAQCKALAEQLEVERKSHQITVKSHQKENANLCDMNAALELKLIEFQNRSQQPKPNDQNSMGNRDQLKLKNRLTKRYLEEKSKEEGNLQSSTVSVPSESSQPPSKRQKIDQSATNVDGKPAEAILIPPSEREQLAKKTIETTEDRQPIPILQDAAAFAESIAGELDYNSLIAQMLDPLGNAYGGQKIGSSASHTARSTDLADISYTSGTSNYRQFQTDPTSKKIRITRVIIDSDDSSDDEPVKPTTFTTLPPVVEIAGYKELASLTQSDSNVPVPRSDPAKVTVATESPKTSSLKAVAGGTIPNASHSHAKQPASGVNSIKKIVVMPSSTKAIHPMKLRGGGLPQRV